MSDDFSSLFETPHGQSRLLDAGNYLFHQGAPVRTLFLVTRGEVQLIRHQEGGAALVLQRAGPGDILAEASVYARAYHCDAIAHVEAGLRGISRGFFLERIRENPDLAAAWAARLAREIQTTRLRSEILSLRTVADRLDAWLAWHGTLPAKGEWNQVARQIAVSPEALYREIGRRRAG
ncbi:Crp/Fnr family transcriptional regulator [Roseibium sp. Sym1]|uniref:Crp/Fnr family transcriptional regulator n=1 Tax=Roseibium sp. Sym1 TaxID=3016006 RepID=UPI0022B53383|nr:Crp/Fnr family transcriptional regulator [Roseibium sp. Sym1]